MGSESHDLEYQKRKDERTQELHLPHVVNGTSPVPIKRRTSQIILRCCQYYSEGKQGFSVSFCAFEGPMVLALLVRRTEYTRIYHGLLAFFWQWWN